MKVPCLYFLLLCLLLSPDRCLPVLAGDLHPIILVPGLGGSQIEASLTAAYEPTVAACRPRDHGWFRLWIDRSALLDTQSQICFAERMRLFYDPEADDYSNAPGVRTRIPFFGSTMGFRYTDPDHKDDWSSYMAPLVERLEAIGYVEGETLFGAPYDFRHGLASSGHPSRVGSRFLRDFAELVENASTSNGGKPVIILTHSFGGLLALQLLDRHPAAWRKRFVKHFVPLAAPWGGSVLEMFVFATGTNHGLPFVDNLLMRPESQSWESNLWLLPSPRAFGEAPIVVTNHGNYSATRMTAFLEGVGFSEGVGPYQSRILPLLQELNPPLVPVTCIAGTGVATAEVFVYGDGGFDEFPEIVYGDGDGTVNLVSLLAIESEWSSLPEQDLKFIKLPNISHRDIVSHDSALSVVIGEILEINDGALRANS
ncbi:lecithin-cholesterol acyltransferase-like 1 [Curcuma longa]|uniref:lecithin-cholesterol acyltransferase-like 1 n=1 Tax=Curcuma longa TaxID=136217 RepID=UPI003D9F9C79